MLFRLCITSRTPQSCFSNQWLCNTWTGAPNANTNTNANANTNANVNANANTNANANAIAIANTDIATQWPPNAICISILQYLQVTNSTAIHSASRSVTAAQRQRHKITPKQYWCFILQRRVNRSEFSVVDRYKSDPRLMNL